MKLGGVQHCSLIDYPGHVCAIAFTVGCNFRCPYCHNPELVEETADEHQIDDFFTFLKQRQGKLDAVTITGGEPTLHNDLPEFIARIRELGYKIKLDSNGTNPAMLKSLFDSGQIDYFAMDIKSPLSKYSATIARPVDLENIKTSISLVLEGSVPYEFRTTVVKSMLSRDDFQEIGMTIKGAQRYYLQKFVPTKLVNPQFRKKVTYSDEEFAELATLMEQYVDVCEVR